MTNADIHVFRTRDGQWAARTQYSRADGTQLQCLTEADHSLYLLLREVGAELDGVAASWDDSVAST